MKVFENAYKHFDEPLTNHTSWRDMFNNHPNKKWFHLSAFTLDHFHSETNDEKDEWIYDKDFFHRCNIASCWWNDRHYLKPTHSRYLKIQNRNLHNRCQKEDFSLFIECYDYNECHDYCLNLSWWILCYTNRCSFSTKFLENWWHSSCFNWVRNSYSDPGVNNKDQHRCFHG